MGHGGTMMLRGFQPVNEDAPVSHISYFEADAFARWSGHRLPTEFEWETVAAKSLMDGNFANSRVLTPYSSKGFNGRRGATVRRYLGMGLVVLMQRIWALNQTRVSPANTMESLCPVNIFSEVVLVLRLLATFV